MLQDGIKVIGHIKVWKNGVLIEDRPNIVTTVGKNALASLLNSASAGTTFATHIGFGTSATAVAVGDTTLGTELVIGSNGYNRVAVARSNPSGNTIRYTGTLSGVTNNPTIQEVGLLNASSAGSLIAHQLTGAVNLAGTSDSLAIQWDLQFV